MIPGPTEFVENFAGQWLQLRKLGGRGPRQGRSSAGFDDTLRDAMRQETERFFADILAQQSQRARVARLRLHVPERDAGPALRDRRRARATSFAGWLWRIGGGAAC